MPTRKIPHDAFDYYFGLGPERSYEKVASRYGVTKRAVTKLAAREGWQARVQRVEAEAREKADRKKAEVLHVQKEQHLQALRLVLGKGVEALSRMHIMDPMDGVRAIGLAVREIRVEQGEPSERTAVSIEDVIKREYERWMVSAGDGSESGDEPLLGDAQAKIQPQPRECPESEDPGPSTPQGGNK